MSLYPEFEMAALDAADDALGIGEEHLTPELMDAVADLAWAFCAGGEL